MNWDELTNLLSKMNVVSTNSPTSASANSSISDAMAALQKRISDLEQERDMWKDKHLEASNQNSNEKSIFKVTQTKLQTDLSTLETKNQRLTVDVATLKEKKLSLERDLNTSAKKIAEISQENKILKIENESLKATVSELSNTNDLQTKKLTDLSSALGLAEARMSEQHAEKQALLTQKGQTDFVLQQLASNAVAAEQAAKEEAAAVLALKQRKTAKKAPSRIRQKKTIQRLMKPIGTKKATNTKKKIKKKKVIKKTKPKPAPIMVPMPTTEILPPRNITSPLHAHQPPSFMQSAFKNAATVIPPSTPLAPVTPPLVPGKTDINTLKSFLKQFDGDSPLRTNFQNALSS
eukprot:TRINITY_DN2306_c1_g1_i1.p1 TRINITY_DN2306_c1_g1~~TRINITY_DN2306_c1_g1_i1.p1  ORF type:complete len:349 (+),score=98.15 TRINITY_DN2306_c1_g1_i1:133-1179(+)